MQKLSKRSVVCAIASAQNHAGSKRLICAPSSQARDNEACRRYTTIACMCRREWSVLKSCIRGHNATYARYSHAHIREGHQSCVFFFCHHHLCLPQFTNGSHISYLELFKVLSSSLHTFIDLFAICALAHAGGTLTAGLATDNFRNRGSPFASIYTLALRIT